MPAKAIKIAEFAKTHFGIELTDAQLQYIAIIAAGEPPLLQLTGRRAGMATANKVIFAYLQDGLRTV